MTAPVSSLCALVGQQISDLASCYTNTIHIALIELLLDVAAPSAARVAVLKSLEIVMQ